MLTIHAPHSKWHFNLPFESDFARVALASFTICVAESSHVPVSSVIFFASIGGVRWLRPSAARSQHARNRASTWKAANCVWFPILWAGCVRAKIVPCYRWGDQCTVCRAWFKGSCLKIPLFCWKFPFFGCTRLAALVPYTRMPTVPFLQYLVLYSSCKYLWFEQNVSKYFFPQRSLCVHFYGNKMKNTVFQAKILFFILKNTFFFRKRLASLLGERMREHYLH